MDLKLLKDLSKINTGICLEKGKKIITISPAMTVLAISEKVSDIDFNIYDISSFLSIIGLTGENRQIEVVGNQMVIKGCNYVFKYLAAARSAIVTPPEDLTPLTDAEYVNEFHMTAEDFKQLITASNVLKSTAIRIVSSDGKIKISSVNEYEDSNSFSMDFNEVENSEDDEIKIDRETLKVAEDAYDVAIGPTAVRFSNENITYYVVRSE
jgi:hypothetical protein